MTTTLEGGEGSASRPDRSLPPGKTRYPLYRRLDRSPGPAWTDEEISPPTGIQTPDRPTRRESVYRLRYPAYNVTFAPRYLNLFVSEPIKASCLNQFPFDSLCGGHIKYKTRFLLIWKEIDFHSNTGYPAYSKTRRIHGTECYNSQYE